MKKALITVMVGAILSITAAYAQSDDNDSGNTGASGVVTDSDGNQSTVDLPDVPDRTPYPADQKTQDFMNGHMPSGDQSSDSPSDNQSSD
jgi:hypothetical protein